MNVERPRSSYARNKSVMHNALDETNYGTMIELILINKHVYINK